MAHRDDIALMAHLMRRAGFGAGRDELEARVAKGYDATVEELLRNMPIANSNGVPVSNYENGSNTAVGAATVALRGFDTSQVREFLHGVADAMRAQTSRIGELERLLRARVSGEGENGSNRDKRKARANSR